MEPTVCEDVRGTVDCSQPCSPDCPGCNGSAENVLEGRRCSEVRRYPIAETWMCAASGGCTEQLRAYWLVPAKNRGCPKMIQIGNSASSSRSLRDREAGCALGLDVELISLSSTWRRFGSRRRWRCQCPVGGCTNKVPAIASRKPSILLSPLLASARFSHLSCIQT